nr:MULTISPECIES: nicotinamide riboside transporter PnuC [Bacillus]
MAYLGLLEKYVLHGSLPFLNSLTAVLSLTDEYWLSRKYLENWHLWIIADGIAVFTVFLSGLYPMVILMGINTLLSIQGLREWTRNQDKRTEEENKLQYV